MHALLLVATTRGGRLALTRNSTAPPVPVTLGPKCLRQRLIGQCPGLNTVCTRLVCVNLLTPVRSTSHPFATDTGGRRPHSQRAPTVNRQPRFLCALRARPACALSLLCPRKKLLYGMVRVIHTSPSRRSADKYWPRCFFAVAVSLGGLAFRSASSSIDRGPENKPDQPVAKAPRVRGEHAPHRAPPRLRDPS